MTCDLACRLLKGHDTHVRTVGPVLTARFDVCFMLQATCKL